MKTTTKVALGVLAAGVVCCVVAVGLGAKMDGINDSNFRFLQYKEITSDKQLIQNVDISSISLDIDTAQCTVRTGDTWSLSAGNSTTWGVSGNKLVVEQHNKSGWWFRSRPGDITLTVPEGTQLTELTADIDAGSAKIYNIQAQRMSYDVDAGSLQAENIHTAELRASCDAGNIDISGIVAGDAELDCDVGNIDLSLLDGSTIGRVSGDVDLGNVSVRANGETISDRKSGISQQISCAVPNAPGNNLLTINCDVGNVDVQLRFSNVNAAVTQTTTAAPASSASVATQTTAATVTQEG